MAKMKPWYSDPTKMIPLGVGSITLFGALVNFFVADARQSDRVELLETKVEAVDVQVEEQADALQDSSTQQQLIQKDVEYIKAQSNQILEAIKQRR